MAILKTSYEEPLLSKEQSSVVRAIAHATQLTEALIGIKKMREIINSPNNAFEAKSRVNDYFDTTSEYLEAEIKRVLMQIKIPKRAPIETKVDPSKK